MNEKLRDLLENEKHEDVSIDRFEKLKMDIENPIMPLKGLDSILLDDPKVKDFNKKLQILITDNKKGASRDKYEEFIEKQEEIIERLKKNKT